MPDHRDSPAMPADRQKLTPPQLARRLGVSPDKILAWIRSGELRALNAATNRGGRPRWLIDEADVMTFETLRSAPSRPSTRRRRRSMDQVIEFF
jgi:excisionase family DNA binding protein